MTPLPLKPSVAAAPGYVGTRRNVLRHIQTINAGQNAPTAQVTDRLYTNSDAVAYAKRKYSPQIWHGFVGTWHMDLNLPSSKKTVTGLRTWKWRDEEMKVLDQVNVYDKEKPPSQIRESDGLWQTNFFYDYSTQIANDEGPVVASPEDSKPHVLDFPDGVAANLPWTAPRIACNPAVDESVPARPWGLEMYLRDGENRWSVVVLYDQRTGDLTKVTFIQEYYTDIKPSTPNVIKLASSKMKEARESLDMDPSTWLTANSNYQGGSDTKEGLGRSIYRNPADNTLRIQDSSHRVHLALPDAAQHPANCVMLLPDAMYVCMPMSLLLLCEDLSGVCRVEFGGAMRSKEHRFQRLAVEWDTRSQGMLKRMVHECY